MHQNVTKPIISLKQFMLKQEVKSLYRRIFKTIRQISDETQQNELKSWARTDFRNNATTTDETAIKMLLMQGERSLKTLQTSLNLAK